MLYFTWKLRRKKTGQWIEDKYKKRSKKKETLPNWANENIVSDDRLPENDQKEMQETLERLKNLKK